MNDEAEILRDPRFQQLLAARSRWRWGFSAGLLLLYFGFCIGGVYFPAIYALPVPGTSIPAGIAMGYFLIALSVFLSMLYIRIIGRLVAIPFRKQESGK